VALGKPAKGSSHQRASAVLATKGILIKPFRETLFGSSGELGKVADSLKRHYSMIKPIRRRAVQVIFTLLAVISLPLAVQAATINIILSDMDVTYSGSTSGGSLFDLMGGFSGGTLDPSVSDDISTAVFERDDNIEATLVNNAPDAIHADFRLTGVGPTITKNVFVPSVGSNGGAFGFDLFIDPPGADPPEALLRLGVTSVSLLLTNNVFFFTGEATIISQNLPAGLILASAQPVVFSYTATLPAVNGGLTTVSMAGGSGAFTISGTAIPEPTIPALAIMGSLSAGVIVRRRRSARK